MFARNIGLHLRGFLGLLLGRHDLQFLLLAERDVGAQGKCTDLRSLLVQQRRRAELAGNQRAVASNQSDFVGAGFAVRAACHVFPEDPGVFLVGEVKDAVSDDLLAWPLENPAHRIIHLYGGRIVIDQPEALGTSLKDFADLLFTGLQPLLIAFTLGDVAEADDGAYDRAVLDHRRGPILDGHARAILAPQQLVVNATGLALLVGGEHRTCFLRILAAVRSVVMKGGVRRLPDEFLGGKPEHPAGGGVHESDAAFDVRAKDALGAGFEDEPRALFAYLELLALGGQLALLGQQFFLLRQQLFLRLRQLLRLLLELAGLFLRLGEQFLRADVALQDLQAHRHHGQ